MYSSVECLEQQERNESDACSADKRCNSLISRHEIEPVQSELYLQDKVGNAHRIRVPGIELRISFRPEVIACTVDGISQGRFDVRRLDCFTKHKRLDEQQDCGNCMHAQIR